MGTLLKVEKVLGLGSPASVAGVLEGDVLVTVQETLVTLMKHSEVSDIIHNTVINKGIVPPTLYFTCMFGLVTIVKYRVGGTIPLFTTV